MAIQLAFWIIFLVWTIVDGWRVFSTAENKLASFAPDLIPWLLILIIGWSLFGAPIK